MPQVITFHAGTVQACPVRNLGWLLKHWQAVESFTILHDRHSGPMNWSGYQYRVEGWLIAHLRDDAGCYVCRWADLAHCANWLDRPVFQSLSVREVDSRCHSHGTTWTIGERKH